MASIVLMGPGGTGKTTMAVETAVKRPVHVLDLDDKVSAMERLKPFLKENGGDVTYWPLRTPVVSDSLEQRAIQLSKNLKPTTQPQGWRNFATMCRELDEKEEAKAAMTVVVDSMTRLSPHLKAFILYNDSVGKSTLSDRDYGSYLTMFQETMTILHDWSQRTGKDLIFTVHERTLEIPREGATIIRMKDAAGIMRREVIGPQEMKIGALLEGQFPLHLPTFVEEVYALRVDMDEATKEPRWICRVQPDGVRDLRTSHKVTKTEFNPDFREIWGVK